MTNEILRGAFEQAILIINNKNNTPEEKLREVKLIIKEYPGLVSAYFESPDHRYTRLLFAAAAQDCLELVKYFLNNGVDINTFDKNNYFGKADYTAVSAAFESGSMNTLKYLISNGADISMQQRSYEEWKQAIEQYIGKRRLYDQTLLDYPINDLELSQLLVKAACARKPIVIKVAGTANDTLVISPKKPSSMQAKAMEHLSKRDEGKHLPYVKKLQALSKYWDDCEKEIDEIKKEKIPGTDLTVYDILINSEDKLHLRVCKDKVVQYFDNNKTKFPIYADMLKAKTEKTYRNVQLDQDREKPSNEINTVVLTEQAKGSSVIS